MSQTLEQKAKFVKTLREIAKSLSGLDDEGLDESLKPNEKTKVSYIPEEYHDDFFKELVDTRGVTLATGFINRNGTLSEAFPWALSKKGHDFWVKVEKKTIKNYNKIHSAESKSNNSASELELLIKEAEDRGFAEGVSTIHGVIRRRKNASSTPLEHELLPNGDLYYYNIKVRKNGQWIAPNVNGEQGYTDEDLKTISSNAMIFPKEVEDAIHDFMKSLSIRG